MQTIRLISAAENTAAMNMAVDEALAALTKEPILRFYTWKPAAITIGFFQSLDKEVNRDIARKLNIDIVRRYTGGGAVFHDKELTYSFICPESLLPNDIIESYKLICSAIIAALEEFNLSAEFKPINDIIVNNRKISGNAQTRKAGVVLQHGTILRDVEIDKMFSILKVPDEKIKDKIIDDVKHRVTSLKNETQQTVSVKRLEEAMINGFKKVFKTKIIRSKLTKQELDLARQLCEEKYSTQEWNSWR